MACLIPEFEDDPTEVIEVPGDIRAVVKILGGDLTQVPRPVVQVPANAPLVSCLKAGDGSRWFWLKACDLRNARATGWVLARRVRIGDGDLKGPVLYISKTEWEGVEASFSRSLAKPQAKITPPATLSGVVPPNDRTGALDDLVNAMPTPPPSTPRKFMSKRDRERFGV